MSNAKSGPWNAESIRQSRKARGLTQAELAESLGCRQQTISEWELGMYEPKNAYQKLLSLFFGSTPVIKEEVPAHQTWGETATQEPAVKAEEIPAARQEPAVPAENINPTVVNRDFGSSDQ